MTTYTVQGPSGKSYTIDGPEGATADQLGQVILANSREERVAAETARERVQYNPTNDMSTGDRLLAGIGRGYASVGRAVGQLVGLTNQNDVDAAKTTDAPLMGTTSGKVGSAIGTAASLAPVAFVPGANTYAGAATIGGITGAVTTEGGLKDRALGAAGGAAGGAIGLGVGRAIGAGANYIKNALAQSTTENAGRSAAVQAAQDAGYVLPPNEIAKTVPNAVANAWAGPIKTAQAAAAANQQNTNALARAAVGLEADTPITKEALAAVRSDAGSVYNEVRGIGQVTGDQTYLSTLNGLKAKYASAASDFPELIDSKVTSALDAIAKPSFKAGSAVDAIRILRDRAATAFAQGDKSVGNDLKGGADALEGAIERTLERQQVPVYAPKMSAAVSGNGPAASSLPALPNGFPGTALSTDVGKVAPTELEQVSGGVPSDLLDRFRAARTTIAKTYDIEKALQGENVNAQALARVQNKTGRLTDELAQIAHAGQNFPKVTRVLTETPAPYSAVDAGLGVGSALHNPLLAAAVAARPVVRSAILSQPGQAAARFQPGPTTANALALALQNPATRRLLLTGGITQGSNLLATYGAQQ